MPKRITLDLFKEGFTTKNFVTRVGDMSQQIEIRLVENGVPVAVGSKTVKLKGITPDNKFVSITATTVSGNSLVTMTQDWNSKDGAFKVAYIEVSSVGTVLTTQNINWVVLPSATVTDHDTAHYIDELQKVIDELQDTANDFMDGLETQLSDAQADITQLEQDVVSINDAITQALQDFQNGNFYTKPEADAKFALKGDVPTVPDASLTQKGVVKLFTGTTSNDETMAVTPRSVNNLRDDMTTNYFMKTSPVKVNVPASVNFTGSSVQKGGVDIAVKSDIKQLSWAYVNHNGDGIITANTTTGLVATIYDTGSNVVMANSSDNSITVTSDNKIKFTRAMLVRVSSSITIQGVTNGAWKDARFRLYDSADNLKTATGLARVRQRSGQNVIDWASLGGSGVVAVGANDYMQIFCNGDITTGNIQVMNVGINEVAPL